MKEIGLDVRIDVIGNAVGVRPGLEDGPPVMTGSHIDTVRTGGLYDGNLGVLAGLEVIETLNDAGISTRHSLAVGFFTNEEGARFAPDMMGSLVFASGMDLDEALGAKGIDGATVGEELTRIGYNGPAPVGAGANPVKAFVELHVEQGAVLEEEGGTISAVESVRGISWAEFTVTGVSNHAGTTPMRLRHDAGYVAAAVSCFVRDLAMTMDGDQVAMVGLVELKPNLINVIANKAQFTVDLRNTDEALLQEAEAKLFAFSDERAESEGVRIEHRSLARFEPVQFDPDIINLVEAHSEKVGLSNRRMASGAGHDAQMFARICPMAMIFVPSEHGISHNIKEHTEPKDIEAGANVLLHVLHELAL